MRVALPSLVTWPRLGRCLGAYRTLLSSTIEPPLDLSVVERPCTVVLAEDPIYSASWQSIFQQQLPSQGLSFRTWSLDNNVSDMDGALSLMKTELSTMSDAILVARGPWTCWLAQFYLESLALQGLVMVDPLPLDDRNGINQFELVYRKQGLQDSMEYRLYQEFSEHWDHWTLRLEPGVIPMLVVETMKRPTFHRLALATANRHSDPSGPFGPVPVIQLDRDDDIVDVLDDWIDSKAL